MWLTPCETQPSQNQGVGRGVAQIGNELKLELSTERYPVSGRILISQRSFGLSGNSATAFFTLRAATSWGSSTYDVLEPALEASGVRLKIGWLLSVRGITLCQ